MIFNPVDFRPAYVIDSFVAFRYRPCNLVNSDGTTHGIPSPQNSVFVLEGVLPPATSATSPSRATRQPSGTCLSFRVNPTTSNLPTGHS